MIFTIFNIIFIIITFIIQVFISLIKILFFIIKFTLTHSVLRIIALLTLLYYLFNIPINICSTLFFLFLVYKAACLFKIKDFLVRGIKHTYYNLQSKSNFNKNLKQYTDSFILLKNITLEDSNKIFKYQYLLLCSRGIFNIQNISSTNFSNNIKDEVISSEYLDKVSENLSYNNLFLQEILCEDIPLINIITLANDNLVIDYHSHLTTAVTTTSSLSKYIEKHYPLISSININEIKNVILENQQWLLEKNFIYLKNFIWNNKYIILFVLVFSLLFYFYNIAVNYFL